MAIIVSEETGRVSVATKGTMSRDLSRTKDLNRILMEYYYDEQRAETVAVA